MDILLKVAIAGGMIVFASWLAGKRPDLGGFIIALPIASILALVMSHIQTQNSANTIFFASGIQIWFLDNFCGRRDVTANRLFYSSIHRKDNRLVVN